METVIGIASILLVGVVGVLAYRLSGRQFVLSPVNVYMILFVIFHFPLLSLIESSYALYAVAINMGLVSFFGGAYLANRGIDSVQFRREMLSRPILISSESTVWVLLGFSCLVSLAFYRGLPPSFGIVFDALRGRNVFDSLLGMSAVRSDLTKSHYFGGGYAGQGALKLFNEMAWQLVAVFMYLRALTTRKWSHFIVFALLSALVIYGAGAKGPVAYIAIAILVARSFVVTIPRVQIIRYSVTLVVLLLIIQSAQVSRIAKDNDDSYLSNVATAISHRVVAGNGLNTYHLIDLIDNGVLEHQDGRDHFVKLMNSIPGIQFEMPYAHTLFWAISEGRSANKTTYATYTYLGGSFLDFGLYGVVFFSLLAGAVLQLGYRIMMRLPWSTFNIAFCSVLTIHLGQIVAGSLISLPATLVAALVIFVVGSIPVAFGKRYRARISPIAGYS